MQKCNKKKRDESKKMLRLSSKVTGERFLEWRSHSLTERKEKRGKCYSESHEQGLYKGQELKPVGHKLEDG